ncbi:hypothetical protein OIO90_001102 [Microbotryomycetes sp. JL221]|nr:hypothetical protein OIO90_001102 [Microbotryomycetes sp. JL221]
MTSAGNIKVVVRCRPLNVREKSRGAKCLVRMDGNNTYLDPPEVANVSSGRVHEKDVKSFAFDKSYWSAGNKDDPQYASQQTLYDDLGQELLEHAFEGFNTCIFAYGQTGSGKSYSMMGYGEERGIIPLICEALFRRINESSSDRLTFTVEVSYTEIYQEKVRDLLNPNNKGNLKVREHPILGPYVESLSKLAVQNFADIEALMDEGTKVSRISLVDLAGSERANATGATGTRLKEGALINKSLTTLGRVIATLAQASAAGKNSKAVFDKVPYRDSVLTWLLKDSLGGNSKTAMIAAISPADYEETLSTLRYSDQAKKIKNKAVVNEDPNAKLIRELKEELATLRSRLSGASSETVYDADIPADKQVVTYKSQTGEIKTITKAELQDQLEQSEKLMASVTETWEEKLAKTQAIQKEREQALEALGITIERNLVGVHTPKKMPHLVNLNEDPLMSECLIYQIKPGKTTVGNVDSDSHSDIRLSGASILADHCYFESTYDGRVTMHALEGGLTMINGQRVSPEKPRELRSGFRIILGDYHVFRFNHPEQVRRARDSILIRSPLVNELEDEGTASPATRPESPISLAENVDWSYARREAVVARLNGSNINLDELKDDDLNKLYSSILKVRHARTASSLTGSERPESRMSFLDSVAGERLDEFGSLSRGSPLARPLSDTTWSTYPTSIGDSNLTLSQPPDSDETREGAQNGLSIEPKVDRAAETVENRHEKEHMEQKVKALEKQVEVQKERYRKRVRKLGIQSDDEADTDGLTSEEERLARLALDKWRLCRRVSMAEQIMSQAVLVKEANVLSRELHKDVSFQFVIVDTGIPASAVEAISGLTDVEESTDAALARAVKPCVGIKVLDRRNNCTSIWSLAKLQHRLQNMRNLYKWIDKPEYSRHFQWDDPFHEPPSGGFSHIGSALVSLAPLSRNMASKHDAQIYSPYTADPLGECSISIKPLSVFAPDGTGATTGSSRKRSSTPFYQGSLFTFEITVNRVAGLQRSEFSAVHVQVHTSSFLGSTVAIDEDAYASDIVDLESGSSADITLKRTLRITLTTEILAHLKSSYGSIHFFARIKPAHIDKIERWDEARDSSSRSKIANDAPLRGDPTNGDVTRRPENVLIGEQTHDVLAHVEVRELGEGGEYLAVPVVQSNGADRGAFFLRQGLQRRLVIKLSHNSGRSWLWQSISKVTLGNVRNVDQRGRVYAETSAADVELRGMGKQRAEFSADGNASLAFAAAWDSSMHDSPHLNRTTSSGHRTLVRLMIEVVAPNCVTPVAFCMDLAVTVNGRDARPPSRLSTLLSATRVTTSMSSIYHVSLVPSSTTKPSELWRLDTSETYVRGEELLVGWKPRGLSLVRDHDRFTRTKKMLADVEATKAVIEASGSTLPAPSDDATAEERLTWVVDIWRKRFGTPRDVSFDKHEAANTRDLAQSRSSSPLSPTLLVGRTTLIPRSDTYSKRGAVAVLRDPASNHWRKFFGVLKRPYLCLYESPSDTEEVSVINLSTVRVEQSPEIEQMLERKFTFAIFTHQNSYFLACKNAREMLDWIHAIDPALVT